MNATGGYDRALRDEYADVPDAWEPPEAVGAIATPDFVLGHGEVHIWRAALDLPPAQMATLSLLLSDDERDRAARFRFDRDRDRFVAARGLLRTLLGRYLGTEPGAIRFVYDCRCGSPHCRPEHRKPALAPACGDWLRFNLSHADGLALVALAEVREVGVDLERIGEDQPWGELAELAGAIFTPREFADLSALPAQECHAAFFACWTRKEAYTKARGIGLSAPLDQFVVPIATPDHGAFAGVLADSSGMPWSLYDLAPGHGYVGALAVAGMVARLRCRSWPT